MGSSLESGLVAERHDVFDVVQVTRGTVLEPLVGADLVRVAPHEESSMHRHNHSETILYFTAGSGTVLVDEERTEIDVTAGDRLYIHQGQFHAVRTADSELQFLSVQSPPILDKSTGFRDLEPIDD